jgi:hypothetical protein
MVSAWLRRSATSRWGARPTSLLQLSEWAVLAARTGALWRQTLQTR